MANDNVSMASAVASLMGNGPAAAAAANDSDSPSAAGGGASNGTSPFAPSHDPLAPSANLAAYLASLPERASATAWQAESFVPVARSIVQSVRELRLQDVRWFLHQLDLSKNGPKTDDNAAANNVPPTPSSDALSPAGALSPLSPAGGSSSPAVVWPAHLRSPSPLLSSLPLGAGALSLPSSSPYIMDTLFDAIVGLQAQRALATARETKRDNRRRAREQGVPLELIDLLTPLPSVASSSSSSSSSSSPSSSPASLSLPSPASEDALEILRALVRAVDVVGVQVVSAAACIDFLKCSSIPYPIYKPEDDKDGAGAAATAAAAASSGAAIAAATPGAGTASAASSSSEPASAWTVTPEWKRRVRLLEQFGAVLDVERTRENDPEDEAEERAEHASPAAGKSTKARSVSSNSNNSASDVMTQFHPTSSEAAPLPPSVLSSSLLCPVLLSRPPALSWFVHAPFSASSRASQERYLQHAYLSLLGQRQTFLKLLSEDIASVRASRAQSNAALVARAAELQARDQKILADVARFEADQAALTDKAAQARTQTALDSIQAEKLDRDTAATLALEARAHRDAVALRGERIIQRDAAELAHQFDRAKTNLARVQQAASKGVAEVEAARQRLRDINLQYERVSIALENAQRSSGGVNERAKNMQTLVRDIERAIKAATKQLKQTKEQVERSRASTAALQVVELDFRARNVQLLFASGVLNGSSGVSNVFLKIFRCMTGAPDPADPNPEVVWDPEPCAVTELCSPSSSRTQAAVGLSPSWRPLRIDLWKLCAAEYGRYFKIEVWDCDASVRAVQSVVQSAIEANKADAAQRALAQAQAPPELNPDGTFQQPPAPPTAASAIPASVTLPSTGEIKYGYIGQTVMTLQHLLDAQKRREQEAAVSAPGSGLLSLPFINAEKWSIRHSINYVDSGTLIVHSLKIAER